jgi:hypothetical protein
MDSFRIILIDWLPFDATPRQNPRSVVLADHRIDRVGWQRDVTRSSAADLVLVIQVASEIELKSGGNFSFVDSLSTMIEPVGHRVARVLKLKRVE